MWYRESLAVRRALAVYFVAALILGIFNAWGAGDNGGIYLSQAVEVATVWACVFALVVGTHLGSERKKSAHSAFVRPISRTGYAWTVFAVDAGATISAYLLALLAFVGTYQIAHGFPSADLRGVSLLTAAILPVGAVLAWYGVAAAAGVVARGARTFSVLLAPVSIALWCGATVYAWHIAKLFQVLSLVNPLAYMFVAFEHIERSAHPETIGTLHNGFYDALSVGLDTAILFAIGAGALLTAARAWKRAEA